MSGDPSVWDEVAALAESGDVPAWCEFVATSPLIPDGKRVRLVEAWRNRKVQPMTDTDNRRAERRQLMIEFDAERKRLTAQGIRGADRVRQLEEMFRSRLSAAGCYADIKASLNHKSLPQLLGDG